MAFQSTPAVLAEISRLLVQAEKAPDAGERAAAVKQLWSLYCELELHLWDAEKDTRDGISRRVESVVYRSTLSMLGMELALMGHERPASA